MIITDPLLFFYFMTTMTRKNVKRLQQQPKLATLEAFGIHTLADNMPDKDGMIPGKSSDPDMIRSNSENSLKNKNKSKKNKRKSRSPTRVQPQRNGKSSLFPPPRRSPSVKEGADSVHIIDDSQPDPVSQPNSDRKSHIEGTGNDSVHIIDDSQSDSVSQVDSGNIDEVTVEDVGPEEGLQSSFTQLMMDNSDPRDDQSSDKPDSQCNSQSSVDTSQMLADLIAENLSLKAANDLMIEECDKYQKSSRSQLGEIKKLKNENDSLKKELSKYKGMRKFTTPVTAQQEQPQNSQSEESVTQREEIAKLKSKLNSLKSHVYAISEELCNPVIEMEAEDLRLYSDALKSPPPVRAPPVVPQQEVKAFTTSIGRGVGHHLVKSGIDATAYTYGGALIPQLRESITRNIRPSNAPKHLVIQGGGNDCDKYPAHLVIKEYDRMIKEAQQQAPQSHIIISKVPMRRSNRRVNENIEKLNSYMQNKAKSSRGRVSCVDLRPSFPSMFVNDKVHFNDSGKEFYGNRLASEILNFRALNANYRQ